MLGWVSFFGGMLPVRFGEWYWLLRIAFKNKVRGNPQTLPSLVQGALVSYGLDAIGVAAAFVLPGACGFARPASLGRALVQFL